MSEPSGPARVVTTVRPVSEGSASGDPPAVVDRTRPLQDQLLVGEVEGLLSGLSGCSRPSAAQALRSTAARHGTGPAELGARFLAALDASRDQVPVVGDRAEPVVVDLMAAALLADQSASPGRDLVRSGQAGPGLSVLPGQGDDRLVLTGELDLATAPTLAAALGSSDRRVGADADSQWVSLDLTGVTFLDTSGVTALNDAHAYLGQQGARLSIRWPVARGPRWVLRFAATADWLVPGLLRDDLAAAQRPGLVSGTPPGAAPAGP